MTRTERLRRLAALAECLPDAELELLVAVAEGAQRGARVYGPLALDRDRRDFASEALEELRDAVFYVGAALLRAKSRERAAAGEDDAFDTERERRLLDGDPADPAGGLP